MAKNWSIVLQTAHMGAVCSTVDLYLATICVKTLKITLNFRPVFTDFPVNQIAERQPALSTFAIIILALAPFLRNSLHHSCFVKNCFKYELVCLCKLLLVQ